MGELIEGAVQQAPQFGRQAGERSEGDSGMPDCPSGRASKNSLIECGSLSKCRAFEKRSTALVTC